MIKFTFGTSDSVNAAVSLAAADATVLSSSTDVANPSTLVSVSTGILNASHFLINETALSHPAVVRRASYFAAA
mgnify:CR=1 FL=1